MVKTLLFSLIITFSSYTFAAERFLVYGNASIPDLNKSLQSASKFSEGVLPGSNMLIAGAMIAINFNSKFKALDMNSKFRVQGYVDNENQNSMPFIGVMVDKRGRGKPKKKVKLSKRLKLYTKVLGDQVLLSQSKALFKSTPSFKSITSGDADLTVEVYPESYIKNSPENLAFLKNKLMKELSNNKYATSLIKDNVLEKLLTQCSKLKVDLDIKPKQIEIQMEIDPSDGSKLLDLTKSHKGGKITWKDIDSIIKEATKGGTLNSNKGINKLLATFFSILLINDNIIGNKDFLPIKATIKNSKIVIAANITNDMLKAILVSVNAIKE